MPPLLQPPPEPPPASIAETACNHVIAEDPWARFLAYCSAVRGALLPEPILAELGKISADKLQADIQTCKEALGADIVYDAALFESLGLRDFEACHYEHNDKRLRAGVSLDTILQEAIAPHLLKGMSVEQLRTYFNGVPSAEIAIDVLENGARCFMKAGYRPNGGKECGFGKAYLERLPLCNHTVVGLVEAGRCVALSKDALAESGSISGIHVSRFSHADKANNKMGRLCHNLSVKSRNFPSVNESVDLEASDGYYPMPTLPLMPDIAEMACRCQDANPGKQISGATVDVSAAYQQFAQSVETAKLVAAQVKAPCTSGGRDFKILIVIYVVGTFGHTRAGNVYCAPGTAISERHNQGLSLTRSLNYIDDGILVSPFDEIGPSVSEYKESIVASFGPGGVNDDKVKIFETGLEAIGWKFDFLFWHVQPKPRGIAKLMVHLFATIPLSATSISDNDMDRLQGLLIWYASGIPAGKAFIASFFSCVRRVKGGLIALSQAAMNDLMWWRALTYTAYHNPFVLGAEIRRIRRDAVASRFLRTDASTTIGAGGCLSNTRGGKPIQMEGEAVRWTRAEMISFDRLKVSINVLEYLAAVFYVMLWAESLEGLVVHIECDNTAAVSWLMKSRTKGRSVAADAIAHLFTLFSLRMHITIVCTHISGVNNDVADFRSRDLTLCPQEADEGVLVDLSSEASLAGVLLSACNRRELCRSLLYLCVIKPEYMHGQILADAVTSLLSTPGCISVRS